jgi:hypothetical protein
MLKFDSKKAWGRISLASVVACAVSLGAVDSAQAGWLSDFLHGGKNPDAAAPDAPDVSNFLRSQYCPPAEIRVGTEALVIYERGHDGDQQFIRFQGSMEKPVRECHTEGDTMTIRVGIVGRLVAGPKGNAGSFTVPIRVAVVRQHDNSVLFSGLQKAPVSLSEPTFASDFKYVFDNVTFKLAPDDRDLVVYVGYDEGKPKKPAPTG